MSAAAVGISADEVLARTQGAVVNPNLELLFKGPLLDHLISPSRWVQEMK